MVSSNSFVGRIALLAAVIGLLASCMHKKYETPITKNTQQPDKILFDQAMHDIEKGRYETARISLQTLMNTYESSEYMAKAKLAVADSWFREGGANGMAQAEAEYKDFILFYPNMEEAAQAQSRVCDIHYKQMDKSDRDITQTIRAEDECRQLLVQFPNSKFAPGAAQKLRNIQESLAEHEFVVGNFYWRREMNPAAANRLNALVDQYPLYSKAAESLYEAGDAYSKMGPRFRKQAGEMFARIVREYPMSDRDNDAKRRLEDMELPVPKVDPGAVQRAKFEQENYHHPGLVARSTEWLRSGPDLTHAAHEGDPTMTDPKRTIPVSVPVVNTADGTSGGVNGSGTTEVSAAPVSGTDTKLDSSPDARSNSTTGQGSNAQATNGQAMAPTADSSTPAGLPTNRDKDLKKYREQQLKKQAKLEKKKKKPQEQPQTSGQGSQSTNQSQATQGAQTPVGSANVSSNGAVSSTPSSSQPPQQ